MAEPLSLEQILWRHMDGPTHGPAVLDLAEWDKWADDLTSGELEGIGLSADEFAARFFEGDVGLASLFREKSGDERAMHVFEFSLGDMEYVILEEENEVVVVTADSTFAVGKTEGIVARLDAAALPKAEQKRGSMGWSGNQPRAYKIEKDGSITVLSVAKVAQVLKDAPVRQRELPRVSEPRSRLAALAPTKRALSSEKKEQILKRDKETLRVIENTRYIGVALRDGASVAKGAGAAARDPNGRPPPSADPAVLILMPDGTLARPAMGAATRWKDMLAGWLGRMAGSGERSSFNRPERANGDFRYVVKNGRVHAVGDGFRLQSGFSTVGERSLSFGYRPSRLTELDADELRSALTSGGRLVPGFVRPSPGASRAADTFWIHPEGFFAPTAQERRALAGDTFASSLASTDWSFAAPGAPVDPDVAVSDPWSAWVLGAGAAPDGSMSLTASSLIGGLPAALFRLGGAPRAFRHAIGASAFPALGEADAGAAGSASGELPLEPLARRSGALPASALGALMNALERTAAFAGYRLPQVSLSANRDAIDVGEGLSLKLAPGSVLRSQVSLMGREDAGDQVARLMVSLPFPTGGDLIVGSELADALEVFFEAPPVPRTSAFQLGDLGFGAAAFAGVEMPGAVDYKLAPTRTITVGGEEIRVDARGFPVDLDFVHGLARQAAQRSVGDLLGADGAAAMANVPGRLGQVPTLLQQALAASGEWSPSAGGEWQAPSPIRRVAFEGPWDQPLFLNVMVDPAQQPQRPGMDSFAAPQPLYMLMQSGQAPLAGQAVQGAMAQAAWPATMAGGAAPGAAPGATSLTLNFISAQQQGGAGAFASGGETSNWPSDSARGRGFQSSLADGAPSGALATPGIAQDSGFGGTSSDALAQPSGLDSRSSGALSQQSGFGATSSDALSQQSGAASSSLFGDAPQPGASSGSLFGASTPSMPTDTVRAIRQTSSFGSPADAALVQDGGAAGAGSMFGAAGGAFGSSSSSGSIAQQGLISAGGPSSGIVSGGAASVGVSASSPMQWSWPTAPSWWSGAGDSASAGGASYGLNSVGGEFLAGSDSASLVQESAEASPRELGAVRSGARAANNASELWRLVMVSRGERTDDDFQPIGQGLGQPGASYGALGQRSGSSGSSAAIAQRSGASSLGALSSSAFVATGAGALTTSPLAGSLGSAARKTSRAATSLEMSIVAAIPPRPPSMDDLVTADKPLTAAKKSAADHAADAKGGAGGGGAGKLEGTVDAIAQRIYHRIKRRLFSDRERFGG